MPAYVRTTAFPTRETKNKNKRGLQARKQATHLVLPLELGPHGAEGLLAARGGLDVVHDVHVDVVQVDVGLLRGGTVLVDDRPEDVPRLRAAHLERQAHMGCADRRGVETKTAL